MKEIMSFAVLTPNKYINKAIAGRSTSDYNGAKRVAERLDGVVSMAYAGHPMLAFACTNNLCKQCILDKQCIVREKYTH